MPDISPFSAKTGVNFNQLSSRVGITDFLPILSMCFSVSYSLPSDVTQKYSSLPTVRWYAVTGSARAETKGTPKSTTTTNVRFGS